MLSMIGVIIIQLLYKSILTPVTLALISNVKLMISFDSCDINIERFQTCDQAFEYVVNI